jgi:hypothetical protein
MARRLFTLLSGFSVLLFVAAVVLWIRGRDVGDRIYFLFGEVQVACLECAEAGVAASWTRYSSADGEAIPRERRWVYEQSRPPRLQSRELADIDPAVLERLGVKTTVYRLAAFRAWSFDDSLDRDKGIRLEQRGVAVPWWSIVLLSVLLPARWLHLRRGKARGRRRQTRGLCPSCGYDLRATPGRCPECGTIPAG